MTDRRCSSAGAHRRFEGTGALRATHPDRRCQHQFSAPLYLILPCRHYMVGLHASDRAEGTPAHHLFRDAYIQPPWATQPLGYAFGGIFFAGGGTEVVCGACACWVRHGFGNWVNSGPVVERIHMYLRSVHAFVFLVKVSRGFRGVKGRLGGSRMHCACTVHLFYLDVFPDTIVLLCCCPVSCCVAAVVPHFTPNALRTALYMLSLGL